MITANEYQILREKYNTYHEARKILCGNRNYVTPEDAKILPESPTHTEISAIETYEFITNPPQEYFLYVNTDNRIVTTWTGEKLGDCILGYVYRSNMGDARRSIRVNAINGKVYHGIYYCGAGDYARVKMYKSV